MIASLGLALCLAQTPGPIPGHAKEEGDLGTQIGLAMEAASDDRLEAMVKETLPWVERVMGVRAGRRVPLKIIDRKDAQAKMREILRREYPGDSLARLGAALGVIGLVAPGTDVAREAEELYGRNASGFYDHHDHVLYLLRGQPQAAQAVVIAHELAHALQDQVLEIAAIARKRKQSEDGTMALSAALEGQAQEVALLVIREHGDPMSEAIAESAPGGTEMAADQAGVCPWLTLSLKFPYLAGGELVEAAKTEKDPSATVLFKRPPLSTRQVRHPELYLKDEKPREAALGFAPLVEGEPIYETTVGEANIDLLGDMLDHKPFLGAGWQGDRLEVARLHGKLCGVWVIAFDTDASARAFVTRYAPVIGGKVEKGASYVFDRGGAMSMVLSEGRVAVVVQDVPAERAYGVEQAARAAFR
jgi:hypothetical protein